MIIESQKRVESVVVAFRSYDVIRACVLSLMIDPVVGRVVVVNNSPEERLSDVLGDLDHIEVVTSLSNIGFGSAINSVQHIIEAPYVLFANPDCTTEKGTIAALVKVLIRNPRIGIIAPRMVNPDGTIYRNSQQFLTLPRIVAARFGIPAPLGVLESKRKHARAHEAVYVIGSFMLARREALDSVGWFDSSIFLFGEDQDLCRRVRAAGWLVWYEPVGNVVHESGHSWRQLDDSGRRFLFEARKRELRANAGPVQAAVYKAGKPLLDFLRRLVRR